MSHTDDTLCPACDYQGHGDQCECWRELGLTDSGLAAMPTGKGDGALLALEEAIDRAA